ncbi:hypothetical protein COM13_22410 [Bacillus pseudomycoides]|uniref:hypothetical protein n=1 Tax=Bacillus TaxID=1386 RepID=UPI0001A1391B|nr:MULTISPECIES: hypothetical protein [Bacillus]EEM16289.1 hypothetical protein bpmyx0001_26780 [Bacillus pseudomycoides DSM 12442]MCX2824539.1 hypothetical protein [Bacillus sp. DHT2]MDR4915729.1 hypothetical protein [Bacillus pseudomycoides]MED1594430.1 hypothetical protein [Bacillus pseudomycoides]MED4652010.1 hypothetical protein [Bacillus pseudomycoides]
MNGEEYNELVQEVVDFSKDFQFASLTKKLSNKIAIVNDMQQAELLAYEEAYGEDEYTWTDIRELEKSKVRGVYYRLSEIERPKELHTMLEVIDNHVRQSAVRMDGFFNDVVADLNNCAFSRAINGKKNDFFETMFEIYKAGGFPCGWNGEYPGNGRIIAYFEKR